MTNSLPDLWIDDKAVPAPAAPAGGAEPAPSTALDTNLENLRRTYQISMDEAEGMFIRLTNKMQGFPEDTPVSQKEITEYKEQISRHLENQIVTNLGTELTNLIKTDYSDISPSTRELIVLAFTGGCRLLLPGVDPDLDRDIQEMDKYTFLMGVMVTLTQAITGHR